MGQSDVFRSPQLQRYRALLATGEPMRVFRRRRTHVFLTLLAIAMQVVLAFAETHSHTYAPGRA
jgi:hypothetical protein